MDRREWSGVTFFKIVSGSIEDPTNLVIEMIDFFLMNLGSSAFTSFKYTPEITEYQMENEHLIKDGIRTGCLHSHHHMATFFSGEDIDDVVINTKDKSVDFYLSTIVNVEGDWITRVGYRMSEVVESEVEVTSNFWSNLINGTNSKKNKTKTKTERSALYMIPLEVIQEQYQDVRIRIDALKKVSAPTTTNFDELRKFPGSENSRDDYNGLFPRDYSGYPREGNFNSEISNPLDREKDMLSEAQEEEHDRLLGSLMMGSIAFKDGLDKAVVIFRQRCTDTLGNAHNPMIERWAYNVIEKAQTVISIAEGQQMTENYVEFCLTDLIDAIEGDYSQEAGDAEAKLATCIENIMELKATMQLEGITLNRKSKNGHF